MTFIHKLTSLIIASGAALAPTAWAAQPQSNNAHHPAEIAQFAQATAPAAASAPMAMGMQGMPGMAQQMQAMQAMHEQMVAAKTPAERQAMMTEQMSLMQSGMGMMNRMGSGSMLATPGDMGSRQGMVEQRMEMMQSMMQMMMDRMAAVPTGK